MMSVEGVIFRSGVQKSFLLLLLIPFLALCPAAKTAGADGILWGVMDWMINPNAFPDTDTSTTRPVFQDGNARMIAHQYQGANWLDFKLSEENKNEVRRIYNAGHCINLMLYFVSCTYDPETETFSYPLSDDFLDDFEKLIEAYSVGGDPLYIQVFPEFELWYAGKDPAIQDAYRARLRSHFAQMADIARSIHDQAYIGLSFMGLFMADADSHFHSRWDPIISNSDLVYINFMNEFTRGHEQARRMVRSTQLIHENWGKPICFPFVILWDDNNTPIFGREATYEEDAAGFSQAVSDWIAQTLTAPEEITSGPAGEWRTNLASLQERGLFAFSLYSANFSNKPNSPPDPNGQTHPLPSYDELTAVMRATATDNLCPPGVEPCFPPEPSFIENGDFELLDPGAPVFASWNNTSAIGIAAEAIDGDRSARLVYQHAGHLYQPIDDPNASLSRWTVSFDVALSDPGPPVARSFQLNLPHPGGNINLRVIRGSTPGRGTVQFFDGVAFAGGTWVTALTDAVNFSSSEEALEVNRIRLSGDYSGAAPRFDLTVNGTTASDIEAWQNASPDPGAAITQVRFETGNFAAGAWAVVDNVSVHRMPPPAGFSQWQALHFTSEELADEAVSGPAADPAGDGVSNVFKYAFGLDPKNAARHNLPAATRVNGDFKFTYRRARDLTDVELAVEVSPDLTAWHSGETFTEVSAIDDSGEVDLVTVRVLPPLSEAPRVFVRLQAKLVQ